MAEITELSGRNLTSLPSLPDRLARLTSLDGERSLIEAFTHHPNLHGTQSPPLND